MHGTWIQSVCPATGHIFFSLDVDDKDRESGMTILALTGSPAVPPRNLPLALSTCLIQVVSIGGTARGFAAGSATIGTLNMESLSM